MIRLVLFLILFALLSLGLFWLSQNSGVVTADIFGYEIESKVTVIVFVLVISIVFLQIIIMLIYKFINIPISLRTYLNERKKNELIFLLSKILEALANNERKQVLKLTSKLLKFSDFKHLAILLEARNLEPEEILKAKSNLETLLNDKNYKASALISLTYLHLASEKFAEALAYIDQLWAFQKNEDVAKNKLATLMKLGDWPTSLDFLENEAKKFIPKEEFNTVRSVINYKLANKFIEVGELNKAKEKLSVALKCYDNFFPIIHDLIHVHIKLSEKSKAEKLMRTYWPKFSSPIFTKLILDFAKEYTTEDFYSIVKDITYLAPEAYESQLLLAKAALDSDQFEVAFKEISQALSRNKNLKACLLMAEFCQRTHGNPSEILNWLKQAMAAKIDISRTNFYFSFDIWQITTSKNKNGIKIAII